jgi:hypothetical protein
MRRWMEEPRFRAFFEGSSREVPEELTAQIRTHLGPLWSSLPAGALRHDPDAYLHTQPADALPLAAV